jgi:uncharacterized protein (TIGR03435 family)
MKTNRTSKVLHKDLSFWIVIVTLVGAADVPQVYFGFPWFQEKLLASRPALRTDGSAQVVDAFNQPADLDLSKKTYSWQTPRFSPRVLQDTPPQVVLIPTEYSAPSGGWGTSQSNMTIGIRLPADFVLQSAYDWRSRPRMILSDAMPAGQFDFIANLPGGALEALQAEIRKKWGLTAERGMRQTNALFLKLHHTGVPGLQVAARTATPLPNQPGVYSIHNAPLNFVVSYLEQTLQLPVIDQTGLTGFFDIQFPTIRVVRGQNNGVLEQTKKIFLEQLGLELIETNATVEMLVVKKIN